MRIVSEGQVRRRPYWLLIALLVGSSSLSKADELPALLIDAGDRVGVMRLSTLDTRSDSILAPGPPTVYLFWATSSSASIQALGDLAAWTARTSVRWRFVPLNIDARTPAEADAARTVTIARTSGYKDDPVWIDSGLAVSKRIGLVSVPTTIVCELGGRVQSVERGWDHSVTERLKTLFGQIGDPPATGAEPDTAQIRCDAYIAELRRLFGMGRYLMASELIRRRRDDCIGTALPHVYAALACFQTQSLPCLRAAVGAARRHAPHSPLTSLLQSALAFYDDKMDTCLQHAADAISMDSTLAPAWGLLGKAALASNDTAQSARALSALEQINPYHPTLELLRADREMRRGRSAESAARLRRLIQSRRTF